MTGTRVVKLAVCALAGAVVMTATPVQAEQTFPQRRDDRGTIQRGRPDPRDDRGYGSIWDRRSSPRFDVAWRNGEEDGYREGLKDGEKGDRFDPIREKRYRSGDHGYDKRYGSKDVYRNRYRDGYRYGYEQGYQDGRRYDRRNNSRDGGRGPSWWPFGR